MSAAGLDAGRIRRHMGDYGLRLGMDAGRRLLQKIDESGDWIAVRTPKAVRTWAAALVVATQMGLCPPVTRSVPDVTGDSFATVANTIPTADGEPEIRLADYQMDAILENARICVLCWCRQAGKDFTASLKAVLDAIETGKSWYIVSLTQRQAMATAKKAQMHVKAILGALIEVGESEEWVNNVKITSYGVKLPNGAEIVALPGRDPDALAGLTGNVIFTEMALFPDNGEKHWKVVFPLATRGFKVWCISTPRGPETKFSELRRNAQGLYAVHNVTIHDAVAGGMELRDEEGNACTPEDLRRLYNDEAGWSREYLCIEGDDHDPLIPWTDINDCGEPYEIPWIEISATPQSTIDDLTEQFDAANETFFQEIAQNLTGGACVGWDIATSGDFSVVVFGEKAGSDVYLRAVVIMHGVEDFDYQEEVVTRAMETGAVGEGDASGLGREACQRIGKRFGEHAWGEIVFTSAVKTPLFTQLRSEMQSRRVHYPASSDLIRYDLHALGKQGMGVSGKILRVETNRNTLDRRSHCDIATAVALMVDAAQAAGGTGPAFGETVRVGAGQSAGGAESDYDRRGLFRARPDEENDVLEGW